MLSPRKPVRRIDTATTLSARVSARTPSEGSDTQRWLTRNEASDLTGLAVQTIANYERRGELKPKHVYRSDKRGVPHLVAVYDPEELIAKLPRHRASMQAFPREPGEIAARAFELFNEGVSLREIVIELRETPEKLHALHDQWLDIGGADLVITPAAKEALEKILGPFSTVTDLVDRVVASRAT